MGEYVWTTITIGGRIKRRDLPKLQAIIEEYAGEKDSGYTGEYLPIGGENVQMQGEVNCGDIGEDNEQLLIALGLAWRIHYDARSGNWDGGIKQWSPEHGLHECLATEAEPALSLQELRRSMDAGATLADVIAGLARFETEIPPLVIEED